MAEKEEMICISASKSLNVLLLHMPMKCRDQLIHVELFP